MNMVRCEHCNICNVVTLIYNNKKVISCLNCNGETMADNKIDYNSECRFCKSNLVMTVGGIIVCFACQEQQ